MQDYTAKILKAIRKYYGISQIDLSKKLGIRQGTLSKLESNLLELSARQWIEFCTEYKLDPNIIITGKIHEIDKIKLKIDFSDVSLRFYYL